jgi:hypothetical protein
MGKCEHDFRGFDYSKLLEQWITYCSKCGLVKKKEPMSDRLIRVLKRRGNLEKLKEQGIHLD